MICIARVFSMVAGLLVVAPFLLAIPASADFLVSKSTVSAYKAGASLAEDVVVNVPNGKVLKLTKRPGGTTHVIDGPYNGRADAFKATSKCPWYYLTCKADSGDGGVVGGSRGPRADPAAEQ